MKRTIATAVATAIGLILLAPSARAQAKGAPARGRRSRPAWSQPGSARGGVMLSGSWLERKEASTPCATS